MSHISNWICNIPVGDLVCCTLLQGILARCMQSTSNVPLWRLYAKQEWCEGPSSDLEYEREMLVYILCSGPWIVQTAQQRFTIVLIAAQS